MRQCELTTKQNESGCVREELDLEAMRSACRMVAFGLPEGSEQSGESCTVCAKLEAEKDSL